MNFAGLKKLLDLVETYERENGEDPSFNQPAFTAWLVAQSFGNSESLSGYEKGTPNGAPEVANYLTMLISLVSRYANFYARRIFRRSVIYSLDDFGILITLHPNRQLTKTETLKSCLLEKSSGNEVLKRLLKQQLIQETNHPTDRRSKVIELTPQGLAAFEQVWQNIGNMSRLVAGDLTQEEQLQLLHLLSKLHRFHQPIFEQGKEEAVEQLLGLPPAGK